MDVQRRGVFVLFVLLVPVSCGNADEFFTNPITCYVLDCILILYCLVATAFYFREKFSDLAPEAVAAPENNADVYQELERPKDTDPYQVLSPTKRKKRKKKRSTATSAQETDRDPYESLTLTPVPPLPPH
ncbi:T-cell surface glycoprotein CD3 zeta chain [Larimichthys crocea]|uniref:T-cell surface glycoprotein CD3 zeta chain n=1 Tax=Larimichthys crocea TaxID=215358 RepID=UPI000900A53B|nr:T-cell surface glycoprotein CD3 zeta chain [Larimichthys crocea]